MNSEYELNGGPFWDPEVLIQQPQYEQSVLVIGCQKGTVANKIAEQHKDWVIHGIDMNQGYIEEASKTKNTNVLFECVDIRHELPVTYYDWIMLQGFMSWVDKETFDAAIVWAVEGTKKDGYVKLSYDSKWANQFMEKFRFLMRKLLKEGHTRNNAITMIQVSHPELVGFCKDYNEFIEKNYINQEFYNTFCPDDINRLMTSNGFQLVRDASPQPYSLIDDRNHTRYEVWRKK